MLKECNKGFEKNVIVHQRQATPGAPVPGVESVALSNLYLDRIEDVLMATGRRGMGNRGPPLGITQGSLGGNTAGTDAVILERVVRPIPCPPSGGNRQFPPRPRPRPPVPHDPYLRKNEWICVIMWLCGQLVQP